MERNLQQFSNRIFDVLVVGGGIHGAIAAWDAALRGLSVGLIERGDFGSATSQNSLKVIHGGLRYLRDGNLMRIRMMARERTTWMRIAPHLVHPLPCITPTYPKLSRGRLAMSLALKLNDMLSFDHNRLQDRDHFLPPGRVISKEECARLLPGLDINGQTGGATWYDAQMFNSERLLLEYVLSADQAGAAVANYVEVTGFLKQGERVTGVQVRDIVSGRRFDIQSKVILNCAGAWIDGLLKTLGERVVRPHFNTSIALNLVIRQVWSDYAVGLPSQPSLRKEAGHSNRRSQILFIVPWRDVSIIGTWHIPWPQSPDEFHLTDELLQDFVHEVNTAHPGLGLSLEHIQHVHWGFLPMEGTGKQDEQVNLVREGAVIDHQAEVGVAGLISVLGVKYTTARAIAEQAIDLAVRKLGSAGLVCQTCSTPLVGGKIEHFQDYLSQAQAQAPQGIDPEIVEHLVYTYGSEHRCLLKYIADQPGLGKRVDPNRPVTRAEVVHAVQREMAQTLGDVIYRRTELGATGLPTRATLQICAELMGEYLDWDVSRQPREIDTLIQAYPIKHKERALA